MTTLTKPLSRSRSSTYLYLPLRPSALGLNRRYNKWRTGQKETVQELFTSPARFTALTAPTGSGKSLTYLSYILKRFQRSEEPLRACVVTATKALQDQLGRDHGSLIQDIRGMGNYPCRIAPGVSVEDAPCHGGLTCEYKKAGCGYFDDNRAARSSNLVLTNYDYYLYGDLGQFDILVLDEAHEAPDKLSNFLSVSVSSSEVQQWLSSSQPPEENWNIWAQAQVKLLEDRLSTLVPGLYDSPTSVESRRRIRRLIDKLSRLANADTSKWIMDRWQGKFSYGWRWDVIQPSDYSEILFRQVKKVVLVSATIRQKTLDLLGVKSKDSDLIECASTFPVKMRPIYIIKSARIRFDSDTGALMLWRAAIDRFLESRLKLKRKGVIHTASYARQRFLLQYSKFRHLMIAAQPGESSDAVRRFKKAKGPVILVSPAVTTGVDFPGDECRFQVICKVPFPPTTSRIVKARQKADKTYSAYVAMQDVVQAAGRGNRSEDDWCETALIDDNFRWFIPGNRKFAPKYFMQAVKFVRTVPAPLKPKKAA